MSAITTAGGNKIHMEDKAGTERILMHSPNTNSFIRIGAPNDPSISDDDDENWFTVEMEGIKEATKGGLEVKAGLMNELVIGESTSTVAGFRMWFTFMWVITGVFGGKWDFQWPEKLAFKNFKHEVGAEEIKDHVETTLAQAFNTRFTGMENRISLQLQQDAGLRLDAIEQDLQTATRDLRQHVSDVEAAERYNRAIGDEINTVGGYVHAADERLTSVGAEMRQAGAAAKSVARRTATAGVAIGTTGAKVKRAGQLTQEAGALLIQ
jgi:type VI secretion system secreted protein VgrG